MRSWIQRSIAVFGAVTLLLGAFLVGAMTRVNVVANGSLPRSLSWGILLQADRVFYPVGASARLDAALFNNSPDSPSVFTNIVNSCRFRISVFDHQGNLLRSEGACRSPESAVPLMPGCQIHRRLILPLADRTGALLPPGDYRIVCNGDFSGPFNTGFGGGPAGSMASITIQIQ